MLWRDILARLPALLLLFSAPAVLGADAKPVAYVGGATVSADSLARRLAKIPQFQRASLGGNAQQLKRKVLDSELIPNLLYAQEAERLRLAERPALKARERELLREAMDRALRQESASKDPVSSAEISGYFEANRGRFNTPRRIHVWRILTDDDALAQKIIAESKGVDGLARWNAFARESSLDKATHLRSGDLGFVHPDGNTDTPTLRVDATLFATADTLADGEIAPRPIKEGLHLAVLWRRGSMKAVTRALAQEESSIRQVLERERAERAREELLSGLRTKYVSAENAGLLETFRFDAQGLPVQEPVARPTHAAAAASQAPAPSERGER